MGNVALVGKDEAVKIARFEYSCMVAVHEFIREHNIACDAKRGDTADVIYDESQWNQAIESIEVMRKYMGENDPAAVYTVCGPKETAQRFFCENAVGSIVYKAGSLSAYKLVIGILKLALGKGLNMHCNTAVTAIERALVPVSAEEKWLVQTPRGKVVAGNVIMATNGYTAHLYPKLQGVIVPLRGHVTVHRPGIRMPKIGLQSTYSFVYENGYEYMIPRPHDAENAGDLVIGGGSSKSFDGGIGEYGNTDDTIINEAVVNYLTETTAKYFSQSWGEDDPSGRIRAAWCGIMGYSGDGLPFVGPVPGEKRLFISASFQGHGMVLCWLCAKALTHRLLQSEELCDWFPRSFWVTEERMRAKFKGKLHSPKSMKPKRIDHEVQEMSLPV
jgi:glycine/D-amino acid oxidase-like deaminating enzyme